DHAVDRAGQCGNLPLGIDGQLLLEVAVGHGRDDLGDATDLAGEVAGHEVHVVGQVLPGAGHSLHLRLTAQLAFGTDFTSHARHFACARPLLVHHGVDGVLELGDLAFDVDGDLLSEVAVGHGGGDVGDVAYLSSKIAGHEIDAVGQVLPRAGHALD